MGVRRERIDAPPGGQHQRCADQGSGSQVPLAAGRTPEGSSGTDGARALKDGAMADYLLFMHDDATGPTKDWEGYLHRLRQAGAFEGGSAIGGGVVARKIG